MKPCQLCSVTLASYVAKIRTVSRPRLPGPLKRSETPE
jgi:hypothetical protein